MNPRHSTLFLILCAVTAASCGGDSSRAGATTARDSAGITIIESAEPVWAEGEGWRVTARPLVEIGVVEGDPLYQLYQVRSPRRLPDGRIALLDGGTAELRIYDTDGRHLLTAGGRGDGPGEFRYPNMIVVGDDGAMSVWDAPMGPISYFDPDGGFISEEPYDRARLTDLIGGGFEGFTLLPDGSLVINSYIRDGDPPPGELYRPQIRFLRVPADFSRVDTLGQYGGLPQMYVEVGGRRTSAVVLFATHAAVAGGGDPLRIFAGNGDTFQIDVYAADGRLQSIFRRTDPPRPIPPEAVAAARDRMLEWGERSGRREESERSLAALPEQNHFPAWASPSALKVDPTGALWVQEYPDPASDTSHWAIFDETGVWLGRVALPNAFTIDEIGSDYVLGVLRDEADVERVVLYGLDRTAA